LVTVYTRQFKIVAYADAFTKVNLDKLFDKTFMIIKPKAMYDNMGHIVHQIQMSGVRIANVSMQKLDEHDLKYFGDEELISEFCLGVELLRENALQTL